MQTMLPLKSKKIQKDMKKVDWDYVPRAKLAASLHFYSGNPYIPNISKLVKYLLEILCMTICSDDKQIRYLAAWCYRPNEGNNIHNRNDDSVFIEVEKLTDYKEKFRLYTQLIQNSDFQEYVERRRVRSKAPVKAGKE